MVASVFAALTAFFVSLALLPFIILFSQKKNLYVALDQRRIHTRITPSLGGVAIFLGFVIGSIAWADDRHRTQTMLLLAVITIPFVIGFLDDLVHLKPSRKIMGQAIAATLVFLVLDVKFTSFYGLFAAETYPAAVSFFFTLVFIIIVTNSFNLIDGIDGLAATFSLLALLFFGMWFLFAQSYHYALICFALAGSIIAFLFQNWEPAKIFMGDTGSLIIGTMLSILTIEFLNENHALPEASEIKFRSSIGTAICILIVPLVDTVRVVMIRLGNGLSPMTADKRHIHHVLVRIGSSHRLAVSIVCISHVFFIASAIALRHFSDLYVLTFIFATSLSLCLILQRFVYNHASRKK